MFHVEQMVTTTETIATEQPSEVGRWTPPVHRGLLMKPPMIAALLREEWPKGQTRRPISPYNSTVLGYGVTAKSPLWKALDWKNKTYPVAVDHGPHMLHCEASEYLHVAAWTPEKRRCDRELVRYRVRCRVSIGDLFYIKEALWFYRGSLRPHYSQDEPPPQSSRHFEKQLSPIHMAERYARIWLKVIRIRAQQVQCISNEDAIKEGLTPGSYPRAAGYDGPPLPMGTSWCAPGFRTFYHTSMANLAYRDLYESIHGEAEWKANPWVWVYDVEMVARPDGLPTLIPNSPASRVLADRVAKVRKAK